MCIIAGQLCTTGAAAAQGAGRKIAYAIFLLAHAAWIVAESPQEAHGRFRGLGAESPVCGVSRTGAKIPNRSKITNRFWERLLIYVKTKRKNNKSGKRM
jgi:hypothetical protein